MHQTTLFAGLDVQQCRIEMVDGALALRTPYHPGIVEAIKTKIPYDQRKWDGTTKRWLISPAFGAVVQQLLWTYFNEDVALPKGTGYQPVTPTGRLLKVRYIGSCKARPDGSVSAFGMIGSEWGVIFPEAVLKDWFGADLVQSATVNSSSLYALLGIRQSASADEIKRAFRRVAKQWHPDVCREADAKAVFQKINAAWQILSDDGQRQRYDAGLMFERMGMGERPFAPTSATTYRSPLRCGWIYAEGEIVLGRFVVAKILEWQDITNEMGQVLVTSWAVDAKEPVEAWV